LPGKATIDEVNNLDESGFLSKFGSLYEHSPWAAEAAWRERPFDGLPALHEAFVRAMYEAPRERQLALIRAHPDLAGKAAVAGGLAPESTREQEIEVALGEIAKIARLRLQDLVETDPGDKDERRRAGGR
jgi:2-oxo-4-hydroxy-4-carboxy--5-ureidoimidazoline (OHCU) decarboxylase